LEYLQKQKPQLYSELLIIGKLAQHCTEIDKIAFERSEQIQSAYLETYPIQTDDFQQRVQARTQARDIADEIMKSELIYI